MSDTEYSPEEVAARGEEIYAAEIRPEVEQECHGRYLVLDIESGDYEIAEEDLTATKRLMAKRPDAVIYGLRIGYPAAYRIGGFSKVR
ncbi:MAG: hypothetical protein IID44_01680 [Planctomycetes bacterium]|nr:hypothetical protein [Planctomycetota bacterium]